MKSIRVCIPHTRGDGPLSSHILNKPGTYSPHAWGWTEVDVDKELDADVFPTRVGMDRCHLVITSMMCRYSPHAWGWTIWFTVKRDFEDVFPTRVGMDHKYPRIFKSFRCIPHTRGDGPLVSLVYDATVRVFPTRVGMDRAAYGETG